MTVGPRPLPSGPAATESRAEVLGMARGGGVSLAGALFNQGMRFVITLLLARLLGSDDVGLYFQAYAFLTLLDILALSGFKKGLTRYVAVHLAEQDRASLVGTVRLGLGVSCGAAVLLAVVLYAVADIVAVSAFGDPRFVFPLRVVAATLPATVFTDAALAATQGWRTMRPYALIGLVFEPACRIVLTVVALSAGWGLRGAMLALFATNVLAAMLAAGALLKRLRPNRSPPEYKHLRELFGFSSVSWVATLASTGLVWLDTLLLGLFGTPDEVGVYQVATRLVLLATVFMQPIGASFAPRVADLHQRGRRDALQHIYALATSWILRMSLPAFIVLIVFPSELLSFFGPRFTAGATVAVLLAIGQLFDVATGPCGHVLVMSGRPSLSMASNIFGLVLNVALNLWLIPAYGIVGAGIAWASSLAVINVMRVALVWRELGLLPIERGLLRAAPAVGAAACVALTTRWLIDGPFSLVVGACAVVAVYLVVIKALGITAEDRLVLSMLRRRLKERSAAA
jgi:O-antigen/teichoic acid export membrane protein